MTLRRLAIAFVLLAACYNPSIQPGQQQCTADGQCPEGQYCTPDKHCYPNGVVPSCSPACAGTAALCDKTTLKCVQCLADGDCPAGFLCAAHVCKPGCSGAHPGCAADAGACDVDLGVCRGCLSDSECPMGAPRCEPMNGVCVACLDKNDNCADGSYCDVSGAASNVYACKPGCKDTAGCSNLDDGGAVNPSCCTHQCADLNSDDNHCGACDKACSNGQHCCNAACTDFQSDKNNCGTCANVCAPLNVTNGTILCTAGACDYSACDANFDDCDKNRANGCEVNLQNDIMNCGACGNACITPPNAMAVCTMGVCAIAGCKMGFADCNANFKDGCEVNLLTDLANCGKCKTACPMIANGAATCNGACGLKCNAGFADCDGMLANGCEINTTNDASHCGSCLNACVVPNALAACVASACAVGVCANGFKDCDGKVPNGCEAATNTDVLNCGGCGTVCSTNNIARACAAGSCNAGTCNAGFLDCNGNKQSDGCEINGNSDVLNCGGCGTVCSTNNIARACAGSSCNAGTCSAGFLDCNNNKQSDGCEVNSTNDVKNCGTCGTACALGANATGVTCTASACKITACAAGFADCDGVAANGCEVNLTSDSNNCSGCGKACAVTAACANSVCTTKCSVVAAAACTAKGVTWKVTASTGALYCLNNGTGVGSDCNDCTTYNLFTWKASAKDACSSPLVPVPGTIYGGHSPCTCAANDLVCGTFALNGCYPD